MFFNINYVPRCGLHSLVVDVCMLYVWLSVRSVLVDRHEREKNEQIYCITKYYFTFIFNCRRSFLFLFFRQFFCPHCEGPECSLFTAHSYSQWLKEAKKKREIYVASCKRTVWFVSTLLRGAWIATMDILHKYCLNDRPDNTSSNHVGICCENQEWYALRRIFELTFWLINSARRSIDREWMALMPRRRCW